MNSTIQQNTTTPEGSLQWLQTEDLRWSLFISYIVFGVPAVLSNFLILFIIFSNQQLRSKSALIVGLAGGNIFNGLHALGFGIFRTPLLQQGTIDSRDQNIWWCMATLLPACMLLGYSLPAAMQFVAGIERLTAVSAFNWYRTRWSPRKNWLAVLCVYAINICLWIVPLLISAYISRNQLITRECSSGSVIGVAIIVPLDIFIVFSGCCGVICLLIAVVVGHGRSRRVNVESSSTSSSDIIRYRKQYRLSKMMLAIAICELCLVVIPNVLVIVRILLPSTPITSAASVYGVLMYCLNSTSNIFIYLCMNTEFRKIARTRIRSALRCENSTGAL